MSLYLGNNLISGSKPINLGVRNIGEIVTSSLPLTDAGLHLLDGSLILGGGIYQGFVDYIAELYTDNPSASYFAQNMTWVQPILTSATSYGTVSSDYYYSDEHSAWYAFNGVKGTSDKYYSSSSSAGNIIWQLPSEEINISSCKVYTTNETSYLSRFPQSITIYGSNDGSTWTELGVASGYSQPSSASYVQVNCTDTGYYQYIKWEFGAVFSGAKGNVAVSEIEISATVKDSAEANWQQSVTDYGVCGKFVYDSVNNTVRLPKITGIVEGTTDASALGDLVEAGLPNITGSLGEIACRNRISTGAFNASGIAWNYASNSAGNGMNATFDASRSSSIYGNSSTVQPQTIKAFYYIVIANSTKTEIQVDIDEIATDLNGKADVDLTNTTDQAKILMSGMGMPSNTYVNLTLGASGSSYTAPADGWICLSKEGGSADYQYIYLSTGSKLEQLGRCVSRGSQATLISPVRKGEVFKVSYTAGGATNYFRFIYAVGSESEAS